MGLIHYVILVLTTFYSLALADRCVYHHIDSDDTYVTCHSGCCYSYINPCCESEFLYTNAFIIPMSIFGGALLIAGIVFFVWWNRRPTRQVIPTVSGVMTVPNNMYVYGSNQPRVITAGAPNAPPAYFAAGPPAYSNPPPAYEDKRN